MDYTAEAFDQMQLLWSIKGFNDHQLRCVLRFRNRLDAEALNRAVITSIQFFPILGTRYVGGVKPRWTSLDAKDFGQAFVTARDESEFDEFLTTGMDEGVGPQVKVCLLNSIPFSIALKINHMVCDAADFKRYIYFLCKVYSQAGSGQRNRPIAIAGDRSVRSVLKRFAWGIRVKSLLMQSRENNCSGGPAFPLDGSGPAQPFILTSKLGQEATASYKDCGRAKGATLNDVMLTVFYRYLFRRLALGHGSLLRVPVMVDMRRYLPKAAELSPSTSLSTSPNLSNLTSTVSTQLESRPAEGFEDTLGRVKAMMDRKKRSRMGLNGFIKLDRAYRFLGSRVANRLLKARMKNPLISMTNMGILDSAQIWFGDQRPCDAFLCGSIKYKPYFQLAMSSYHGELTLSANLLGSDDDRDRILSFFDEIEAELLNWELSGRTVFPVVRDRKEHYEANLTERWRLAMHSESTAKRHR